MKIEYLKSSNAKFYRPCLSDVYIKEILDGCEDVIAIGALETESPCGAVFARVSEDVVLVKSLFVLPLFRRKGVASALIDELKSKAKEIGMNRLKVSAVTAKNNVDLLDKFLTKKGFPQVEILARVYKVDPAKALKKSKWIERLINSDFELPDKVAILVKDEVDKGLLDKLKQKDEIKYPDNLSPFKNEFNLQEEFPIFAVFDNKKIVGWFTNFKTNDDKILYRSFFVDEPYRKSKLGLIMFAKIIKHHFCNYMDQKVLFAVALDDVSIMNFYLSFFNNSCDSIKYEFSTNTDL